MDTSRKEQQLQWWVVNSGGTAEKKQNLKKVKSVIDNTWQPEQIESENMFHARNKFNKSAHRLPRDPARVSNVPTKAHIFTHVQTADKFL